MPKFGPSLCRADIPVCRLAGLSSSASGDWNVARTRRLESLRYLRAHNADIPVGGFTGLSSPEKGGNNPATRGDWKVAQSLENFTRWCSGFVPG
jgi:hypothetical protein